MNVRKKPLDASQEDIDKMMSLLAEYSVKLRTMCDGYNKNSIRRSEISALSLIAVIMSFSIAILTTIVTGDADIIKNFDLNEKLLVYAFFVVGILVSLSGFARTTFNTRNKSQYDMHQVAVTLEKIVRMSSQYGEHAISKIGDRFEFEIRLAEAEASLRVYEEVFRHKYDGPFSYIISRIIPW